MITHRNQLYKYYHCEPGSEISGMDKGIFRVLLHYYDEYNFRLKGFFDREGRILKADHLFDLLGLKGFNLVKELYLPDNSEKREIWAHAFYYFSTN
jgi:hypothetical protein